MKCETLMRFVYNHSNEMQACKKTLSLYMQHHHVTDGQLLLLDMFAVG